MAADPSENLETDEGCCDTSDSVLVFFSDCVIVGRVVMPGEFLGAFVDESTYRGDPVFVIGRHCR